MRLGSKHCEGGSVVRRLVTGLAVLAAALTPQIAAATGNPILDAVNAQRQANGIPPVTWNADWAEKCTEFNAYAAANLGWDRPNPHGETPGKRGYTEGGNWAGAHAVLARGGNPNIFNLAPSDDEFATPWEWAPSHLMQVLSPTMTATGGAASDGYTCLTTWPGIQAAALTDKPTFYSYPGNGTTGIYGSERASEWPQTPEQALGLDPVSGPNIFVYAEGFSFQDVVSSASLTDASGRMTALGVLDWNVVSERYYREPGSVLLVPKTELIGHTRYGVAVTLSDSRPAQTTQQYNQTTRQWERIIVKPAYTAQASYTFSFTTGRCDECRHLPDQPVGLIDMYPVPGQAAFTLNSNGLTFSSGLLRFSQLRAGMIVNGVCRTGLTAAKKRGRRACNVWALLASNLDRPLGDGETTISLSSLFGPHASGPYRITATVAGQAKTIEVATT